MIANLINRYKAWCFAPTRKMMEWYDDKAMWAELYAMDDWSIEL